MLRSLCRVSLPRVLALPPALPACSCVLTSPARARLLDQVLGHHWHASPGTSSRDLAVVVGGPVDAAEDRLVPGRVAHDAGAGQQHSLRGGRRPAPAPESLPTPVEVGRKRPDLPGRVRTSRLVAVVDQPVRLVRDGRPEAAVTPQSRRRCAGGDQRTGEHRSTGLDDSAPRRAAGRR